MYDTRMASVLSGATPAQLHGWRTPRGNSPALLVPANTRGKPYLYSFDDIVALRTCVQLRNKVSLQMVRKAVENLRVAHPESHLSSHSLRAAPNRKTIVWLTADGEYIDVVERPGQQGIKVVMEKVFGEFTTEEGRRVPDLSRPTDGITIDYAVRGGFPVLEGTRLKYDTISELTREGLDADEIIYLFPSATTRGIAGATEFANMLLINDAIAS